MRTLANAILSQTFDDADVAVRAARQRPERFLVGRTVVGGNRLVDAVELDHHDTLLFA